MKILKDLLHRDSLATQSWLTSVSKREMLRVGLIFCYPSVLGSRFCESDAQQTLRRQRAVKAGGVALCTVWHVATYWRNVVTYFTDMTRCNLLKNCIFLRFNLNYVSTCNLTSDSPSLTPPQRYSGNTDMGYSYSE